MNEKYTLDERNARAREFSDAVYRELRSINNLATAFFNAGMLSRGLYITDYFIHQSLERSNHTRQVMTTGEWPVLNGKPVTPRVVRQLAERYHRKMESARDDYDSDGLENWRLIRAARAQAGEQISGQNHPPRFDPDSEDFSPDNP